MTMKKVINVLKNKNKNMSCEKGNLAMKHTTKIWKILSRHKEIKNMIYI